MSDDESSREEPREISVATPSTTALPASAGEEPAEHDSEQLSPTSKPRVFLCHALEQGKLAGGIATCLQARGYATWYYERDSITGKPHVDQTGKEIRESFAVLVLVSQQALTSQHVETEVFYANDCSKPLLSVLVDMNYEEFQQEPPSWAPLVAKSTPIPVGNRSTEKLCDLLVKALKSLGLPPPLPPRPIRPIPRRLMTAAGIAIVLVAAVPSWALLTRSRSIDFELPPASKEALTVTSADATGALEVTMDGQSQRGWFKVRQKDATEPPARITLFVSRLQGKKGRLHVRAGQWDYETSEAGVSGSDLPVGFTDMRDGRIPMTLTTGNTQPTEGLHEWTFTFADVGFSTAELQVFGSGPLGR